MMKRLACLTVTGILAIAGGLVAAQPAGATTRVSASACQTTEKYLVVIYGGGKRACYTGAGNLTVNLTHASIVENYTSTTAGVEDPNGKYYNIQPGGTLGNPPSTVHIVEIDGKI